MYFLQKKFDEWAEDEDEDVMKSMKNNYGPLTQLSVLFPSWKRSMRLFTISLYIVHTFLLSTHLVLLLISVRQTVSEWNLELVSLTVHFALLAFAGLFCICFVHFQRKTYGRQGQIMLKDVGNYRSGRIYGENWCLKEEKKTKRETLYYLLLPAAIGVAVMYIMAGPYIANWVSGMENPYTPNMVNKNLPFPCWYPFPTHEGVLHWVAVLGQVMAACSLGLVIVQLLLFFLINSQRIRFELRVVGYSLETLFPRSTKLFLRMNPDKKRTDVRVRDSRLVSLYAEELNVVGALGYATGTGVIGMSLFNILEALKAHNYSSVVLFSIMLLCETLIMFVMSSLGEAITDQSGKLRNQLYHVKWHKLDIRNRKILLYFQTTITEPIIICVMGLINLSLDTFSSIMNTAYSFFNLMNAQME